MVALARQAEGVAKCGVPSFPCPSVPGRSRHVYDPYGNVTIYDDDWSETRETSDYDNSILYCGYYHDWETGLYHVRNRYYHPPLGRWTSRDPIGETRSLYLYVLGSPTVFLDPMGLAAFSRQECLYLAEDFVLRAEEYRLLYERYMEGFEAYKGERRRLRAAALEALRAYREARRKRRNAWDALKGWHAVSSRARRKLQALEGKAASLDPIGDTAKSTVITEGTKHAGLWLAKRGTGHAVRVAGTVASKAAPVVGWASLIYTAGEYGHTHAQREFYRRASKGSWKAYLRAARRFESAEDAAWVREQELERARNRQECLAQAREGQAEEVQQSHDAVEEVADKWREGCCRRHFPKKYEEHTNPNDAIRAVGNEHLGR